MKFTKNVPTEDGWYWSIWNASQYIPEPFPVLIGRHPASDTRRVHIGGTIQSLWSVQDKILFGDRIETPSVEVEG